MVKKFDGEIELYWNDLCKETQEALLNEWGDNGNYDTLPMIIFPVVED